jgi:hypothetical protein
VDDRDAEALQAVADQLSQLTSPDLVTVLVGSVRVTAGPTHAAGEAELKRSTWLVTRSDSEDSAPVRTRALGREGLSPSALASCVMETLRPSTSRQVLSDSRSSRRRTLSAKVQRPVDRLAHQPLHREPARKAFSGPRVPALQELELVRSLEVWLNDVEPSADADAITDFVRRHKSGIAQQLHPDEVRAVLDAHPEMFVEHGGAWSTTRRGLPNPTPGVSDSPGVRPGPGSIVYTGQLGAPRDITWAQLPSQIGHMLRLDSAANVTVLLRDECLDQILVRIPIELVLDEEPVWVAALAVELTPRTLYTAARVGGWSFWRPPELIERGNASATPFERRGFRPTRSRCSWIDWADKSKLARKPLKLDRVVATYRRLDPMEVAHAVVQLLHDHLGIADPRRIEVKSDRPSRDDIAQLRRIRNAAAALFQYWDHPRGRYGSTGSRGEQLDWCCVCGRVLTDPESVRDGIGPVCAGRVDRWYNSARRRLTTDQEERMMRWSNTRP